MKDFSKDVYGLFPTSYSPINQCARGYTCHCVIIYHFFTMPKMIQELRMHGSALFYGHFHSGRALDNRSFTMSFL